MMISIDSYLFDLSENINESIYYGEIGQYIFLSGDITLKIFELNPQLLKVSRQIKLYACVDIDDVIVLQD